MSGGTLTYETRLTNGPTNDRDLLYPFLRFDLRTRVEPLSPLDSMRTTTTIHGYKQQ